MAGNLLPVVTDPPTQAAQDSADDAAASAVEAAASASSINDIELLHKAGAETVTGVKTFTAQPIGIVAASIGLGNADNTSDVAKPVSTAQQAALDAKASLSGGEVVELPAGAGAAPTGSILMQDGSWSLAEVVIDSVGGGGERIEKFTNGLMIITGDLLTSSSADITITYPTAFIARPRVSITSNSAALSIRGFNLGRTTELATSFDIGGYSASARSAINASYIAIGRWKV